MTSHPAASTYLPEHYLTSTTDKYNAYQQRYAEQPRESDQVLIQLIDRALASALAAGQRPAVLDIGCSTGNFLYHLRHALPALQLTGGDLSPGAIAACQADPRLADIQFAVTDLFDLPAGRFDVIVANAILYYFDNQAYSQALASVARALKPGGSFVSFEFLHPFEQDLHIQEVSRSHPDGIYLHFRPYSVARPILEQHGFTDISFQPFVIPIDLARGARYTADDTGYEDLNSYTVPNAAGERMLFRGALYQPWCHLTAHRPEGGV